MKKKFELYIEELEEKIKNDKIEKDLAEEVLTKIQFYQHERLVHLIVTFFTGIGCILFLLGFIAFEMLPLLLLFLVTICLFIPYIFYYYYLENNVQKLYDIYFDIKKETK